MTFRDAPPLIKDYINYIRTVKGKTDKTADNYFRDLHLFFRFIKFHKGLVDKVEKIEDIDISDINYDLFGTDNLVGNSGKTVKIIFKATSSDT